MLHAKRETVAFHDRRTRALLTRQTKDFKNFLQMPSRKSIEVENEFLVQRVTNRIWDPERLIPENWIEASIIFYSDRKKKYTIYK